MKINFSRISKIKSLTEIISIIVTIVIMLALVGAQKQVQKVGNGEIGFDKMGPVRIINMASGKYLSTSGIFNGSAVSQFSKDETLNQVWQMERQGDGWEVKIVNTNSCLEIDNGSQNNGAKAQIWDCVGTSQQIWKIEMLGKGAYEVRPFSSDKCLEIVNSSSDEGVSVQQWSCVEVMGQRWQIYSALY